MNILYLFFIPYAVAATYSDDLELRDTYFVNNDSKLVDQARIDPYWEQCIVATPAIVNLLGQLMIISSKADFSIMTVGRVPAGGFKHIRNPTSFRATLVQVANDGWMAFENAHSNMNKIRLHMQNIPVHLINSLKILKSNNAHVINSLLSVELNGVSKAARESAAIASSTHGSFLEVMKLLGEIIEATETSRGSYDQKLQDIRIELNVSTLYQQQLEETISEHKSFVDEERDQLRQLRADYKEALDAIPTGWEAIAEDLFKKILKSITNVIQLQLEKSLDRSAPLMTSTDSDSNLNDHVSNTMKCLMLEPTVERLPKLKNNLLMAYHFQMDDVEKVEIEFELFKHLITVQIKQLDKLDDNGGAELKSIFDGLLKTVVGVMHYMEATSSFSQNTYTPDDKILAIAQNESRALDSLHSRSKSIMTEACAKSGKIPVQRPTVTTTVKSEDDISGDTFKAKLLQTTLLRAETRYENRFTMLMEYQEKLNELLRRITAVNIREIRFEDIIQLLKEGTIILSHIRQQWTFIISFCQEMSVRANITLSSTLEPFLTLTSKYDQRLAIEETYRDIVVQYAQRLYSECEMLRLMATSYVEVSNKYVMVPLAGISTLVVTDNDAARREAIEELASSNNETQVAIKRMLQDRKDKYKTKIAQNVNNYQQLIDAMEQTVVHTGSD